MTFLLNVLKVALITHKTVAAVAASIVISAGVIEYLRNTKDRK